MKYICLRDCYHRDKLFKKGDVAFFTKEEDSCKHFKKVISENDQDFEGDDENDANGFE